MILNKVNNTQEHKIHIKNDIIVEGIDEIKVNIASCCKPIPGDRIVGYITKGNGISVHRSVCPNISELDERLIDVSWNENIEKKYSTSILVHSLKVSNNKNLLIDIISRTSSSDIIIQSINTIITEDDNMFNITLLVSNKEKLLKFINDLEMLEDVTRVERLIKQMITEAIYKSSDKKLIKLIKKNKINIPQEELFIFSINLERNNLTKYLIENENIDLNYRRKYDWDALVTAIVNGNIFAIELLKEKGIDIKRNYIEYDKELCVLARIRDLDTLKYFENNVDVKYIKKSLNDIVSNTLVIHDLELLDYVVKKYNVKLTKIKYDKDNFLLDVEHFMAIMEKVENKRSRQVEFVYELIKGKEKKYNKIIEKAKKYLNSIQKENIEIKKYYKYVKEKFEGEK